MRFRVVIVENMYNANSVECVFIIFVNAMCRLHLDKISDNISNRTGTTDVFKMIIRFFPSLSDYFNSTHSKAEIRLQNSVIVNSNTIYQFRPP